MTTVRIPTRKATIWIWNGQVIFLELMDGSLGWPAAGTAGSSSSVSASCVQIPMTAEVRNAIHDASRNTVCQHPRGVSPDNSLEKVTVNAMVPVESVIICFDVSLADSNAFSAVLDSSIS